MSLEEKIERHAIAMEGLTDALQQLASLIRQAPPTAAAQVQAMAEVPNAKPRGPGRPPKATTPPPSPTELAASQATASSAASSTAAPSAAPSTPAGAPAGAPAADDGSAPVFDYATDLKPLVLKVGEDKGNVEVKRLLASLGGFKSALELKDDPVKVAEAVALFRETLGLDATTGEALA
jgi:hypothetical protein